MSKKILCGLALALLAASSPRVAPFTACAQTTAEWLRRQQQQQQQQRQQQQQQDWLRRHREQEAQRQQMREQQRQQMQQRLREQQQQQLRQRQQQQQRQQAQQQQQRRLSSGASGRGGTAPAARGAGARSAAAAGVVRLTRPPTPAEMRRGFTGRVTPDGRALVRFNGRVYAVPAARAGIRLNNLRAAPQSSRWSASKRAAISAEVQKLAAANPRNRAAAGGGRRPPGGGGGNGGDPPGGGRVPVQFGHVQNNISHAFRYTDGIGLDREVVKEAIRGDLAKVADELPKGVHYNGSVLVGERLLVYSAFKLPNGTINVGSIKPQ